MKVSTGTRGTVVDFVATEIMRANGVLEAIEVATADNQTPQSLEESLTGGRIDAAFATGAPATPSIRDLLTNENISALSFGRAAAYEALFPGLAKITIPRGVIDLGDDLPSEDLILLSATTNLVALDGLYPAAVPLLLQAVINAGTRRRFTTEPLDFPNNDNTSIPLDRAASRYYDHGEKGLGATDVPINEGFPRQTCRYNPSVMRMLLLCATLIFPGHPLVAVETATSTGLVERLVSQTENLRPEILELAFGAYADGLEDGHFTHERLTIIDYSLPSYEKRLWVIDMVTANVLFEEIVSHGMGSPRGSGGDMERAKGFSNLHGSKKSSLGLFVTAETYQGQHGYTLRLDGLEMGVNDNARERLIVMHSAHYVTEDRADDRLVGRSWGCPVVRPEISRELIDAIKDGSALWIYYPDEEWLEESEFLDKE